MMKMKACYYIMLINQDRMNSIGAFRVLLMTLLASSPLFIIQAHAQNSEDNEIVLTGRINSMVMPSANQSATNASSSDMASQFTMDQAAAWLLSGKWIFVTDSSDNVTSFDAEFLKVTTEGTMVHTHRITNFVADANASEPVFDLTTNNTTIRGTADVYFDEELAWSQADTAISILNGTVLEITFDSADVQNHFHNRPIYGIVESFSEDELIITLPQPSAVQNQIEQELSELQQNATEASGQIQEEAGEAGETFVEQTKDVLSNITSSIRNYFGGQ